MNKAGPEEIWTGRSEEWLREPASLNTKKQLMVDDTVGRRDIK